MPIVYAAETPGVLDTSVMSYIVDGAKDVIGLLTIQPLGTFIAIGIVGSIVGLVATIVSVVRR